MGSELAHRGGTGVPALAPAIMRSGRAKNKLRLEEPWQHGLTILRLPAFGGCSASRLGIGGANAKSIARTVASFAFS
jgi:hypothetical protein